MSYNTQRVWESIETIAPLLVSAYIGTSAFTSIAAKSTEIATPLALTIAGLTAVTYLVLFLLNRYGEKSAGTEDPQTVKTAKPGKKVNSWFLGIFLFFLTGPLYNYATTAAPHKIKLNFNPRSGNFRVLILPFDRECTYDGITADIGKIIQKRLQDLKSKDTLGIETHYLTDSTLDFKDFTRKDAYELLQATHADLILYGSYSPRQCEGGISDKICFKLPNRLSEMGHARHACVY